MRRTAPLRTGAITQRWWAQSVSFALLLGLATLGVPPRAAAHEDRNTHTALTSGAVHFLDSPNIANEERRLGLSPGLHTIAGWLRRGSQDEDKCPLYANHFYNPASPRQNIAPAPNWADLNCKFDPDLPNYEPDPHYDDNEPDLDIAIAQQNAVQRASSNWDAAVASYESGEYKDAYLLLGHVFHLMQDMTSPAHVHNDPHGKSYFQRGEPGSCWTQDADDFENWGYCAGSDSVRQCWGPHGGLTDSVGTCIRKYFRSNRDFPSNPNIQDWTRTLLDRIYGGKPQSAERLKQTPGLRGGDENFGAAYVRQVAEVTFDFTTFGVELTDNTRFEEAQTCSDPFCEFKAMFPTLAERHPGHAFSVLSTDTFGGKDIGWSDGHCGRSEGDFDFHEEWWPMEDPQDALEDPSYRVLGRGFHCERSQRLGATTKLRGWAYVENSGGEGAGSTGVVNSLVPRRYLKPKYFKAYAIEGADRAARNRTRTLLQIYGDVLYPTAVAYGAGLLQAWVDEMLAPVANAGGPYQAHPTIFFNSEGSQPARTQESHQGHSHGPGPPIVSYWWDFNNNREVDGDEIVDSSPTYEYDNSGGQLQPGSVVRLEVTDADGFTAETKTTLEIPTNQPPNAVCQSVVEAADEMCVAQEASVDDGSSDPDGEVVRLEQAPPPSYNLESTSVTLIVTDDDGASSTCDAVVTIIDIMAPEVSCPAPQTVECTSPDGTTAEFAATAFDNCDGEQAAACDPVSGSAFALGMTGVTCEATDEEGNAGECPSSVTVVDTRAPDVTCPAPQTLECTGPDGATAALAATASDVCDGELAAACDPISGSTFALGTTVVRCGTADGQGNPAECGSAVTVEDTTDPTIQSLTVSPDVLGPRNHEMVEVTPSWTVADACDTAPLVELASISSNESDNWLGDGNTVDDIQVDGDGRIHLRAEASGQGSGRIYTLSFRVTDASGNQSTADATVVVPHDAR